MLIAFCRPSCIPRTLQNNLPTVSLFSQFITGLPAARIAAHLLILACVTGTLPARSANSEVLRVGIFPNKPIVYYEDGAKGLFVDILNHTAEKEGWNLEYIPCDLEKCLDLIREKKLDIIPALEKNSERLKFLSFSTEPVWTFWETIYSHKLRVNTLFDLQNKKIGVVRKSTSTGALQNLLTSLGVRVQYVTFDDYDAAVAAIHMNKVDAVALNNTFGFLEQRTSDIYPTSIVFNPSSAYFTVRKNGPHADKLAAVDKYTKHLKADEESLFYQFQQKWFSAKQRYWTVKRITLLAVFLLLVVAVPMAFWRYRSLRHINRQLTKSIARCRQIQTGQNNLLCEMGERIKEQHCMYAVAELIRRQKSMQETHRELVALIPPAWQYPEITSARLRFHGQEWISESFTEAQWKQSTDIIIHGKQCGSIEVFYHEERPNRDEGPFLKEERDLIDGIARSISEFNELNSVRKNEELLLHAVDQAYESVVLTDLRGDIQYINPAFERLTGYRREEILGKNPRLLKSGKHDTAFYKQMWDTLLQEGRWRGHLINRRKDGSLFEEDATITTVRDDQGQITNFVAMKRDVTREVSLEKQLRQASKMEAIGTLAGGIAHDFNNILGAILGYGEMAKDQLPVDEPARQDIQQLLKAGNRAAELVKQILAFSRQGEIHFAPVHIQSIVKEALKLLQSSLPTTIHIEQHIDSGCPPVLADPTQIHQVLLNICTNAKHAMGEDGGTLTVSLSQILVTEADALFRSNRLTTGNYLDLTIGDTGCGMNADVRNKIFDPFFTTKKIGEGTGLGLSVIHGIVGQHRGEITVRSSVGEGTVFHVYLPVINEKVETDPLVRIEPLPPGDEHILLVDDEPAILDLLQRMLGGLGYTTTAFANSREALNHYKTHQDNFDLLISDMTMPEMTGTTLAREVLNLCPDFPVILCSGFSENMTEDQIAAIGIKKFILKPILKHRLAKAVREVLDNG